MLAAQDVSAKNSFDQINFDKGCSRTVPAAATVLDFLEPVDGLLVNKDRVVEAPRADAGSATGASKRRASASTGSLAPQRAKVVSSAIAPARPDDLAGLTLELSLLKKVKHKKKKLHVSYTVWHHSQVLNYFIHLVSRVYSACCVMLTQTKAQTGGMTESQFERLDKRERCALLSAEIARSRALLRAKADKAESARVRAAELASQAAQAARDVRAAQADPPASGPLSTVESRCSNSGY